MITFLSALPLIMLAAFAAFFGYLLVSHDNEVRRAKELKKHSRRHKHKTA